MSYLMVMHGPGPRLFTKLLKPPLAELRELSIFVAAYIDDLFTCDRSEAITFNNVKTIISTFGNLGFTMHPDKSVLKPSQIVEYLGF